MNEKLWFYFLTFFVVLADLGDDGAEFRGELPVRLLDGLGAHGERVVRHGLGHDLELPDGLFAGNHGTMCCLNFNRLRDFRKAATVDNWLDW